MISLQINRLVFSSMTMFFFWSYDRVQPIMIWYFQRWYCRCLLSQPGDDDQREWRHLYHCHQDNCQDHWSQVQVRILFWFLSHLRPSIAWPCLCWLIIVETGWMWLWLLKMAMRNLLTLLKLLVLVLWKCENRMCLRWSLLEPNFKRTFWKSIKLDLQ